MNRLVVISDIHCGSSVALCPPDFTTTEGQKVGLNKYQQWAWAQWLDFQDWVFKGGKYTLVLNGDLIEGIHHRSTEIISADPADHYLCAQHVLNRIVDRAERVYVVRGTDTHTGPSSEHGLATWCGAIPDKAHARPAWDRLDLEYEGVQCRFVHHGVGSRREWTRLTALNVDIDSHRIATVDAGGRPPQVLGLGHFHHYAAGSTSAWLSFRTPSWQFNTRHTMKVVPWAENEVGGVVLEFDGKGQLPRIVPWIRRPKL